ncbi:hypothetical protein WA026_014495 [Henosepilachna vigintioctopunctata]|uniref:trypsin n=1 Tax=Henosepilachna vigintioctopunctata TaxID=420089 RepID=A0AAW1UNW7_9CUCU
MIQRKYLQFLMWFCCLKTGFFLYTNEQATYHPNHSARINRNIGMHHHSMDFKIIGGKDASVKDFPYMVSLQDTFQHICGGTIVSELFILTAAHCVTSKQRIWKIVDPIDLNVVAGQTILDLGDCQLRDVKQLYVHPNYSSVTVKNDVALVLIFEPFKWTTYVNIVKLYTGEQTSFEDYKYCTACGWGVVNEQHPDTGQADLPDMNVLQRVDLPPSSEKACRIYFDKNHNQSTFDETKLCIIQTGGKDTCFGDSGGPLICGGIQYGITSFGIGCAMPHMFGIYVNISAVRDWIFSTMRHPKQQTATRHVKMVEYTRHILPRIENESHLLKNTRNVQDAPKRFSLWKIVVISSWISIAFAMGIS